MRIVALPRSEKNKQGEQLLYVMQDTTNSEEGPRDGRMENRSQLTGGW